MVSGSSNPFIRFLRSPLGVIKQGTKGIADDLRSLVCHYTGHRWRYKNYTNWIKEDGSPYDFRASRVCLTCGEHGYYFHGWEHSPYKISEYDVIEDECLSISPPDFNEPIAPANFYFLLEKQAPQPPVPNLFKVPSETAIQQKRVAMKAKRKQNVEEITHTVLQGGRLKIFYLFIGLVLEGMKCV